MPQYRVVVTEDDEQYVQVHGIAIRMRANAKLVPEAAGKLLV